MKEASSKEQEQMELTNLMIRKQLKGNVVKDAIIPLASLIVALASVMTGYFIQQKSIEASVYNSTVSLKQKSFSEFLHSYDQYKESVNKVRHMMEPWMQISFDTEVSDTTWGYPITSLHMPDSLLNSMSEKYKITRRHYLETEYLLNEQRRKELYKLFERAETLEDTIYDYTTKWANNAINNKLKEYKSGSILFGEETDIDLSKDVNLLKVDSSMWELSSIRSDIRNQLLLSFDNP